MMGRAFRWLLLLLSTAPLHAAAPTSRPASPPTLHVLHLRSPGPFGATLPALPRSPRSAGWTKEVSALFPRHRLRIRRGTLTSPAELRGLLRPLRKESKDGLLVILFEGYLVRSGPSLQQPLRRVWLTQQTRPDSARTLMKQGLTRATLRRLLEKLRLRWLWIGEGLLWDATQGYARPISDVLLSRRWPALERARLLRQACARGAFQSCRRLGEALLRTTRRAPNAAIARVRGLFARGCKGGDGRSCQKLGLLYQKGIRLPKEPRKARALFAKACQLRDGEGCLLLGFERQFRERKVGLAAALYKRGCELRAPLSCALYANALVLRGKTPKRCGAAKKWVKKACQMGLRRACSMKLCP